MSRTASVRFCLMAILCDFLLCLELPLSIRKGGDKSFGTIMCGTINDVDIPFYY